MSIPAQGFSASQVHFSREFNKNSNLPLNDARIKRATETDKESRNEASARCKARGAPENTKLTLQRGVVAYVKAGFSKHEARSPIIVTKVDGDFVTGQKVLNATGGMSR